MNTVIIRDASGAEVARIDSINPLTYAKKLKGLSISSSEFVEDNKLVKVLDRDGSVACVVTLSSRYTSERVDG